MSVSKSDIKIKPSLVPFTWKGIAVVLLAIIVYAASVVLQFILPLSGLVIEYAAVGLVWIGLLIVLVGAVRRNAFTYTITDSAVVVQKQLFSRSVRRIPFMSISDVEVSQTFIGRLAGYGNVVPVSKSGYGLVRGMEASENLVAEMTDIPNPDKVADLILSRVSNMARIPANA